MLGHMRTPSWPLVFVSTSLLMMAALVLLPAPQLGSTPPGGFTQLPPLNQDGLLNPSAAPTRVDVLQSLQIQLQFEDQNGTVVPGVEIICDRVTAASIGRIFAGQSDHQGRYSSLELVAGDYEVQLTHPEFLATKPLQLHLPQDADVVQIVRLQRGCVVEGRLFGSDGNPRNHGFVVLKQQGTEKLIEVKPDVEGTFHFPAVADGNWELSWYSNPTLDPDSRLLHSVSCTAGGSLRFQITIAATDLRAQSEGGGMDVGIEEV